MVRWRHVLSLAVMGGSAASTFGLQLDPTGADQEKIVTARRIQQAIVIDGTLDEPQWELAEPVRDFFQQEPSNGEPVSELTEVRLLYDDQNLYVGIYCFDSEGEKGIVINDIRRDFLRPLDNDGFAILLDTFDDNRNAFFFNANARGAKSDQQIGDDGGKRNRDWDGIWHVKTKINESGWQAEMAIPFKTLRFPNKDQQSWGINFQRRIRRKNEASHWAPIPRPYRFNRISRAGRLEGLVGIRPGRNLQVKPYITAPVLRRREDDVDFVPDAGLDVKYGLNSQLTLDLTVNTDFSQVEADDEQINLTRFSLFFPEKREFFLENATTFQFGPGSLGGPGNFREFIPFFSRRIGISAAQLVPILGGTRLSGRSGQYTLGLLSMQVDESEPRPSTNFSLVRVRRDILGKSDIGGLFISKHEGGGHFNRTYGGDVNFTFFDSLNLSSFLVKTTTPEIHDQDLAGYLGAGWTDSRLTLQASYLSIQDNVNPEVGFVPRKGIRKSSGSFGFRSRPRDQIPSIRELEPLISAEYITNQEGMLETRNVEGRFTVRFQNGGSVWFAGKSKFERLTEPFLIRAGQVIPLGDHSFNEYTLSFLSDQSRMFNGSFRVETGGFFDGEKDSYRLTGRFQQPQFQVELSWSHDDVSLPSGDFKTDLVTTRLNYSFSTTMFLNALIQYNSDLREIGSNIRFNLIHKPLSDFFLVYNERRSSTGEVAERALIAKLTYVFNF